MIHAAFSLRRSVWALALVTALSPVAAFAATPQQIVDANLQRLSQNQPASISGEVKLNVTETPVKKTDPASNGSASFTFNSRTVPNGAAFPNTEGDLSITSFESSGMGVSIPTLTNPGSIEWKTIDGTAYLRIKTVANTISSFLSAAGVDMNSVVGTWLKVDPSTVPACVNQAACATAAEMTSAGQASIASLLKSPIKITGTEKKWVKENGDQMVRVRAIVNPATVNALQAAEKKMIAANDPQRTAKIKAINTRYTELKKTTGALRFALNLNATDNTIERAEAGMVQRQPVKSCTTNKWKITTCKTTSNVTATISVGLNFSPGKSDAIVAPSTSITVDDLIKLLKK